VRVPRRRLSTKKVTRVKTCRQKVKFILNRESTLIAKILVVALLS
jgi:hypothetical protein